VVSVVGEDKKVGFSKGRSRLLYQITLLLVVVFVIIGVAIFLVVDGAIDRLIEEDKQDRIDSEAQIIYSDTVFIAEIQISKMLTDFPELDVMDVIAAIGEKRINDFIRYANDSLRDTVQKGMAGSEASLIAEVSGSPPFNSPFVLAASEDELTFAEVPDYILEAVEEDKGYVFFEEGVPEYGFEGEYLITLVPLENPLTTADFVQIGIRPFDEEIARIDDFYSSERNRLTLILALVMGIGIILVFLITFFILRRMIQKQITQPIDELTSMAGEVMEGNLDVEIDVREGEEFETLKRAFKEMVGSIRSMLERSVGKG